MRKLPRAFGILIVIVLGTGLGVTLAAPGWLLQARRVVLFGGPLLDVTRPLPDQVLGQGGIAVLIQFPFAERTVATSLRCLLNGEDVTERLTLGGNGAAGSVWAPHDGSQVLRIEVFGRTWWSGAFFEDWAELRFEVRPNPSIDRASGAPSMDRASGARIDRPV